MKTRFVVARNRLRWIVFGTRLDRDPTKELDRLAKLGDTSLDPDERADYYAQAGEILIEDVPGPFLYNLAGVFVVNPAVTGYTPTASESAWPGQFGSLMTLDKSE